MEDKPWEIERYFGKREAVSLLSILVRERSFKWIYYARSNGYTMHGLLLYLTHTKKYNQSEQKHNIHASQFDHDKKINHTNYR